MEILKKFDKLYVGFSQRSKDVPLGFMTPYEENAAGIKRRQTVDSWSDKDRPKEIYDNELLTGFKLSESIRRGWNTGNIVWRVVDPRGFELEISCSNLSKIIEEVGVEAGGVIPGRCLWCRVGANNILVPENSADYQTMIKQQELLVGTNKRVKTINNLVPGQKVKIKGDSEPYLYLGQYSALIMPYNGSTAYVPKFKWFVLKNKNGALNLFKNSPVIEILAATEIITRDMLSLDNSYAWIQNNPKDSGSVVCVLPEDDYSLELREVTWAGSGENKHFVDSNHNMWYTSGGQIRPVSSTFHLDDDKTIRRERKQQSRGMWYTSLPVSRLAPTDKLYHLIVKSGNYEYVGRI